MPLISADQAIQKLLHGDVVAVPTETVYGLAALIGEPQALKKIFEVKERPLFDPLIVHVLDLPSARELVASVPPVFEALAKRFWPGPLTLVFPKSEKVNDLITSGLSSVALRSPRHPLARRILEGTGPFAAPSANRFGKSSPTTAEHVVHEFGAKVDVVDGGPCEVGLESTVVRLSEGRLEILRPGRIVFSELEKVAREFGLSVGYAKSEASPGHLPHHYQPEVPLVLVKTLLPEAELQKKIASHLARTDFVLQFLQLPSRPIEAARVLYANLRKLSQNPRNVIVAEVPKWGWTDDSTDLMDRLTRAATVIF